jgi:hypothetical protein
MISMALAMQPIFGSREIGVTATRVSMMSFGGNYTLQGQLN